MSVRRPIKVWGAILASGMSVTTDDPEVVSVTIFPDGLVEATKENGEVVRFESPWISYNPRFN